VAADAAFPKGSALARCKGAALRVLAPPARAGAPKKVAEATSASLSARYPALAEGQGFISRQMNPKTKSERADHERENWTFTAESPAKSLPILSAEI
jgi:hypothetical protein